MTDTGPFKALSLLTRSGYWSSQPARSSFVAEKIRLRRQRRSRPQTLTSELARCRTVTSEDAADYQHCQKVWAENRRRFFGRKEVLRVSAVRIQSAGLTPAPKDQSRMPQGYPSVAVPEASKP